MNMENRMAHDLKHINTSLYRIGGKAIQCPFDALTLLLKEASNSLNMKRNTTYPTLKCYA